jgi:hypothetical protein
MTKQTFHLGKTNCKSIRYAKTIPVGTLFLGKIGECEGLFIKSFTEIILLEDPEHTWDHPDCGIKNFVEVTATVIIDN